MKTKIMKRIVTFVLALVMVCTTSAISSIGTLAVEGVNDPTPVINIFPGNANTITPDNTEGDDSERAKIRFEAYQIFSGELATAGENDELINIDWGNALVKKTDGKLDYTLVLTLLEKLSNASNWAVSGVKEKFQAIYDKVKDDIKLDSSKDDTVKAEEAKGVALEVSQLLNDPDNGFRTKDDSIATEVQKFAKVVKETLETADAYATSGKEIDESYHKWQSRWDEDSEPHKWVIDKMNAGYYFIDDVFVLGDYTDDATAPFMLDVFRTVNKTIKSTAPTLDKSITGVTDLTSSLEKPENVKSGGNSARANIGDTVSYELKGSFPTSFSTFYEKYSYVFTDTLSDGLDMVIADSAGGFKKSDIKVALTMDGGDNWLNIDPQVYEAELAGRTLTVTFDDLVAHYFTLAEETTYGYDATRKNAENYEGTAAAAFAGDTYKFSTFAEWLENAKIRVTYKAKLNANAVVGAAGNPNTAYLTYTNNPNNEATGTSKTTEEKPKVFTYQINLHKRGSDEAADSFLLGATFQVSRKVGGTEYFAVFDGPTSSSKYTVSKWVTKEEAESEPKTKITTIAGEDLRIAGLDAGTYTFTETSAPMNYDLVDPFTVTIADTDLDGNLNTATAAFLEGDLVPDGEVSGEVRNVGTDNNVAHVTVTDIRASILPHTGGSGVYFYYIAGGVLVAAALVLLVVSRRRSRRSA